MIRAGVLSLHDYLVGFVNIEQPFAIVSVDSVNRAQPRVFPKMLNEHSILSLYSFFD